MAYTAWSVVFGEQPSAAKWNILGANDASFNDGTGIANGVITSEHLNATIAFHAYRAAAQTITSSLSTIVFDTERYDLGSDYSTATGKFTAPLAGVYSLKASMTTPTNTVRALVQFVCSTAGNFVGADASVTDANRVIGFLEIDLALGETVEVQGLSTTSNDVADTETWFSGHFIGA